MFNQKFYLLRKYFVHYLRGPGSPRSIFTFFVPGTFFRMKKYCSYLKLLNFQIAKIHALCARTLIANSRKSTLKSIVYSFWDKCLKLGSHVLGTKKVWSSRFLIYASEVERSNFFKFLPCHKSTKMKNLKFQNSIFSLLRPKSKIGSIKSFVLVPRTFFLHIEQLAT